MNLETRLQQLTKSQLISICHKMKCKVSNDNRKNIIKSLMKPLQKKYKMKSLQDMSINTIINSYDVDEYIKKLRENNYSSVIIDQIEDKHIKKEFQFLKEYLRKLETYNRKSLASIAFDMGFKEVYGRYVDDDEAFATPEQVLDFAHKYKFNHLKEVIDIMDSPASGFSFSKKTFLNVVKKYFEYYISTNNDLDDTAFFAQLGLLLDSTVSNTIIDKSKNYFDSEKIEQENFVDWYTGAIYYNDYEYEGPLHNPFYLPYLQKILDRFSQKQLDDLLVFFINLDYGEYLGKQEIYVKQILDIIKNIINRGTNVNFKMLRDEYEEDRSPGQPDEYIQFLKETLQVPTEIINYLQMKI